MAKKIGKEARFLNALDKGRTISRRQAKSNYHLGNPSATILRIEQSGILIDRRYDTKMIKTASGRKVPVTTVKYKMLCI